MLLTSALQSRDAISWAKMLEPVNVLEHILSVTGNTLNHKLLEKVVLILYACKLLQIAIAYLSLSLLYFHS